MNLAAVLLAVTFMAIVLFESVAFYRTTVCRQDAWLAGTVSMTSGLLKESRPEERTFLPKCGLILGRRLTSVSWRRGRLALQLRGKL